MDFSSVSVSSLLKISRDIRTSVVESKAESSARQNTAEDGRHSGGRHSGGRHPGGCPPSFLLSLYIQLARRPRIRAIQPDSFNIPEKKGFGD
jgi:hypothetical protein